MKKIETVLMFIPKGKFEINIVDLIDIKKEIKGSEYK
jgi:hypothetical protein